MAADIILFSMTDEPHALLLGDAARGVVADCLGDTKHLEAEHIEPEVVDPDAGFAHQSLPTPLGVQPEAAVVVFSPDERDGADDAVRLGTQPDSPMPGFTALYLRQRDVPDISKRAVGGVQ